MHKLKSRKFMMGNSPELNFLLKSISRLAQHLVKISYILEHYSKKKFFCWCFPIPRLNTRYFLIGNSSELNFFLRFYLVDCKNWYNFQAIWMVISHGISKVVLKFRIGLVWILLFFHKISIFKFFINSRFRQNTLSVSFSIMNLPLYYFIFFVMFKL